MSFRNIITFTTLMLINNFASADQKLESWEKCSKVVKSYLQSRIDRAIAKEGSNISAGEVLDTHSITLLSESPFKFESKTSIRLDFKNGIPVNTLFDDIKVVSEISEDGESCSIL